MTFSAYNRRMPAFLRRPFLLGTALLVAIPVASYAQTAAKSSTAGTGGDGQRALAMAESGHCTQGLPLLKKAIRQASDKDLKKKIGLVGIHCAMTHNLPYESLDFLAVLSRDFPRDPDVLYAATHAYSDLSLRASQD